MRITPDLELNVAEAVKDPRLGLQHAAMLLLYYDLADENRFIFATEQQIHQIYNTQAMELISRVIEIETRLSGHPVRRAVALPAAEGTVA